MVPCPDLAEAHLHIVGGVVRPARAVLNGVTKNVVASLEEDQAVTECLTESAADGPLEMAQLTRESHLHRVDARVDTGNLVSPERGAAAVV